MTHLGDDPADAGEPIKAPTRRRRRLTMALVVVLALGIGGYFAFGPSHEATTPGFVLHPAFGGAPVTPSPSITIPTGAGIPTAAAPPPTFSIPSGPPTSGVTLARPGALAVSTRLINLGTSSGPVTFQVSNTGGQTISYVLASSASWLTASPASHILAPGKSMTITVRANHTHVPEGDVTETIAVIWDRGNDPVQVKVRTERPPVLGVPSVRATQTCAVQVSVPVSDESAVSQVLLTWSGPAGSGSAPMTRSGSTWTGTAGPLPSAGSVTFTATATDARGNTATSRPVSTTVGPC